MNFWILTTEYPPLSGGGISTYCYHTGQMLTEKGHDVTVFIPDYSLSQTKIDRDHNISIVRFKPDQSHHEYLGEEAALSLSFSETILEYAKTHSAPDFIESQEYNGIAYFALQKKLLLNEYFNNTTFYVTAHAPGFLYLDYNQAPAFQIPDYWTGEMEKSVLKTADFVISPSQYLLDKTSSYFNWGDQETSVIFNPYNQPDAPTSKFEPFDIVFFGKLTPQKGCIELLKYFKKLWDDGFKHPLRLIGGGSHYFYPKLRDLGDVLRKEYDEYIAKDLLIFEGHIDPGEINGRLRKAHVVLVPSIVDNLPYTVLEAMSLGKVVLASDCGGHKELINDGVNGFIFSHDKQGDNFSTKLKHILALDNEAVSKISNEAHETITTQCSYDVIYEKKIALLNEKSQRPASDFFPFVEEIPGQKPPENMESENDLLSVIIPFYNLGSSVEETISSILSSEYKPLEIIIVNDGSTDKRSISTLHKLEKESQITVYNKQNEGLSATRNFGANKANGAYMAFLDADDMVKPDYYSKAINVLNRYENISFVGCWAEYFEASNISWPSFNPEPPYLLVHNMINSSALVYKKSAFVQAGYNDTNMIYGMEDYDSVISLVKNGFRGVAIPEKLWLYRIRKGSMAQSFNTYSKNYLYRLLSKKHSEFYASYATEVINLLNSNGPGYLIENPTRVTRKPFPFANTSVVSFIKRNKFLRNIAKSIYRRIKN